ncbi:MAG: hypothetical protein ACUVT7_01025 [Thermoplasmata archaeon]
MTDENGQQEPVKDYMLAAMFRTDPDKVAALRRIMSGRTRCPACDAPNPADQKHCEKCGAPLYPEVREEEEAKD